MTSLTILQNPNFMKVGLKTGVIGGECRRARGRVRSRIESGSTALQPDQRVPTPSPPPLYV